MDERNRELNLITLAKAGDADAFCRLYGLYQSRLYRYAFYRLGNSADAEDAVSECVLSAWTQIGSLREPQAFPAWIFRILHGTVSRQIGRQAEARSQVSLEDASMRNGDSALPKTEADPDGWLMLQEALSLLDDSDRTLVLLSAACGLKSPEIAEIMSLPAGTVRSRLSRSLKKVRGYYK